MLNNYVQCFALKIKGFTHNYFNIYKKKCIYRTDKCIFLSFKLKKYTLKFLKKILENESKIFKFINMGYDYEATEVGVLNLMLHFATSSFGQLKT